MDWLHKRPLPSLTGIRGLAAIWVLMFHLAMIAKNNIASAYEAPKIFESGWASVDLFFILSGFILAHSHADDFLVFSGKNIKYFFLSRFMRVYPLNTVVLLMVAVLVAAYGDFAEHFSAEHPGNLSLPSFVSTLLLVNRWIPKSGEWNGPTWSLSAEVAAYIVFPFIIYFSSNINKRSISLFFSFTSIIVVLFLQAAVHRFGLNFITTPGAFLRVGGFFTAGVFLRRSAGMMPDFNKGIASILSIFSILGFVIFSFIPNGAGYMPIFSAALIFSLAYEHGPVNNFLKSRVVMFLGKISFPLYLVHTMPLLAFGYYANVVKMSYENYWILVTPLSSFLIFISYVLHRYFEQPIHQWARKWTKALRG